MPLSNSLLFRSAEASDIDRLMSWFSSATATSSWGGPRFRYPFDRDTFHEDCRWRDMSSYVVHDASAALVSFGQLYERYGRINLARIVVNPEFRNQGCGRFLLGKLLEAGARDFDLAQFSLFVLRDNGPAINLYRSIGFTPDEFPPGAPLQDLCYYMTRPVQRPTIR